VVRELLYTEPEGTGTDIPMALDYLANVVRRHAVVFLVSDFQTSGYDRALAVANRRYDLIAIDVSDPREHELPSVGLVELEDAETGERVVVDAADRRFVARFAEEMARRRAEKETGFRKLGVDRIAVSTDRPYVEPLERFFRMRARRAGPLVEARGRR
jgi:hypothetical protein